MKTFPSTSVIVAPRASAAAIGKVIASGEATLAARRSSTSRERGPGIAVFSSIGRVVAIGTEPSATSRGCIPAYRGCSTGRTYAVRNGQFRPIEWGQNGATLAPIGACPQPAPHVPKYRRAPMQNSLKRMWALLGVVAAIAAVAATQAVAAHKAGPTIVIWTDQDRAAAVTKVANDWAASSGATIKVVTKNFGDIRDNLGTVAAADAPGRDHRPHTTGPASWPRTVS